MLWPSIDDLFSKLCMKLSTAQKPGRTHVVFDVTPTRMPVKAESTQHPARMIHLVNGADQRNDPTGVLLQSQIKFFVSVL